LGIDYGGAGLLTEKQELSQVVSWWGWFGPMWGPILHNLKAGASLRSA
jgi:hypothetical protein